MTEQQIELLASIQGLCHTIRDEHGVYVTYTEHLHNGATEVVASVLTGHDGDKHTFHRIGSDMLGSIEAVRDGLAEHLVKMRDARTPIHPIG